MTRKCSFSFTDKTCGVTSFCERESLAGVNTCIFHAPVTQKSASDFVSEFQEELKRIEAQGQGALFDFKGFNFPEIDLAKVVFSGPVDCRASTFGGKVDLRNAVFLSQADFHTAQFRDNAHFFGVIFRTNARFLGTRFDGRAIFNGCKFRGTTTFHGCKFNDFSGFQTAKFDRPLTFQSNEFHRDADFRQVIFYNGVDFTQTLFRRRIDFEGARFHGEVRFTETHLAFLKKLNCHHADMRGVVLHTAQIWENERLSHYNFRDAFLLSVNLSGKEIIDCDFTGAVFKSVLTVGWRPDRHTIERTRYIYTDYTSDERFDNRGVAIRAYCAVPDSRVPAEGEFGIGEHKDFTLATYLRDPVRLNIALSVPPVLRTAVSNYLQLFGEFVRLTEGIPVELRTRLEGSKLRVEFLAESEEDLVVVKEAFRKYQETAGVDFEELKLRIRFAAGVMPIERDLFLMKMEHQMNQLKMELTYTKALLSKSEEHQALLRQLVEASRSPERLFQPLALSQPPVVAAGREQVSPLNVVFSYSHHDEELRDRIDAHCAMLRHTGLIGTWWDRRILPGAEWEKEIAIAFETADIVLLLVSSDFLNSYYCYERELGTAISRHEAGEAVVIPVLLRSCSWKGAPFGKLLGLPTDLRAITMWEDFDDACTNVVEGIRRTAENLKAKRETNTTK